MSCATTTISLYLRNPDQSVEHFNMSGWHVHALPLAGSMTSLIAVTFTFQEVFD